jgi:V8-like Glu-specific endopeptidase
LGSSSRRRIRKRPGAAFGATIVLFCLLYSGTAWAIARLPLQADVHRSMSNHLATKVYIFSDNARDNRLPVSRQASGLQAVGVLSNHRATYKGNAALISPCHVLTVAHVAFSTRYELHHPSSAVHSTFEIGRRKSGSGFAVQTDAWPVAWGSFTLDRRSEITLEGDWAVLRLRSCVGYAYGYMQLSPIGLREALGRYRGMINGVGYDGDHRMDELRRVDACSIRGEPKAGTWSHDCSESEGSSGEPLFYVGSRNRIYIVALDQGEYGPAPGKAAKIFDKRKLYRFFNYSVPVSTFYDRVMLAVDRDVSAHPLTANDGSGGPLLYQTSWTPILESDR